MHHDFAGVDMLEFALLNRAGRLLTNEQDERRIRHSRAQLRPRYPDTQFAVDKARQAVASCAFKQQQARSTGRQRTRLHADRRRIPETLEG